MRIQHNIMAMNAYRNYTNNVSAMKKNLEKLSSGYKINRAGDDAAGLAISEKMRAQITGLQTAQKNAKDGISLIQTAEGALTEVHDMLNRMVTLATQSANGTYDDETDRVQLQKEINQLREEINRIADSSNFNGIKLLDGTLGLNTNAFSMSTAAANSGTLTLADSQFGQLPNPVNLGAAPTAHLEEAGNTKEIDPSFTVDLTGLTADSSASADTLTLNFAGLSVAVSLSKTGGTNSDGVHSASDIATLVKTKLLSNITGSYDSTDGSKDAAANSADSVHIGDFVFTVNNNGSKLEFTFKGMVKSDGIISNGTSETDQTFTKAQADTLNAALGSNVTWSAGNTSTIIKEPGVDHNLVKVNQAYAIEDTKMAGIDFTLDANIVKDGNYLEIDGKKFVFKTDANSTITAGADETLIDVSRATTDADRIHLAVDELSKQTIGVGDAADAKRSWDITSKNGTTIHIEQKTASTAGSELDSRDKLKALFKAGAPATNVGTTIKVTDANVTEGNTLNIDGKKYIFTDDADKLALNSSATASDPIYVAITGGAAQNLSNAISGSEFDSTNNTVTVRAASATDDAPLVMGKGLTLQIGDTADSFNQLNVLVNDTHCSSLGIDDINIANQDGAAAAVDKIKSAINFVSDVRGTLGATQNRLDHTINNLSVMTENIQDAESTIRDTDVAEEMMAYTKNNILIQSAQAMLAQANQVPQGVLQLLQ